MAKNKGLRTLFFLFWTIGSIFWVMIGALDGNFTRSAIYVAIGWVIIYIWLEVKDALARRRGIVEDE